MPLTKKEQSLLKDLQQEEKTCAEKYHKAAEAACDPKLREIFSQIEQTEQQHYDTVTQMLSGTVPDMQSKTQNQKHLRKENLKSAVSRAEKKSDAYLLADLLATEKFVSGVYNTAVFEFGDEKSRQTLSAIQQQEQHHGKELADYMTANGMYC